MPDDTSSPPIPHIEAMVFCRTAEQDDARTWNLLGVFSQLLAPRFPVSTNGEVFVLYTNALGMYRFDLDVIEVESGASIGSRFSETPSPVPSLTVDNTHRMPMAGIGFPRSGRYEFRWSANGTYVASAYLMVRPLSA